MTVNLATTTAAPESLVAPGDEVIAQSLAPIVEQQNASAANCGATHLDICFGEQGWGSEGAEANAGAIIIDTTARYRLWHKYRKNADSPSVRVGIETFVELAGNTVTVEVEVDGVSLHTFSADDGDNGGEQSQTITPAGSGWKTVALIVQHTVTSGSPVLELRRVRIQDVSITSSFPEPLDT